MRKRAFWGLVCAAIASSLGALAQGCGGSGKSSCPDLAVGAPTHDMSASPDLTTPPGDLSMHDALDLAAPPDLAQAPPDLASPEATLVASFTTTTLIASKVEGGKLYAYQLGSATAVEISSIDVTSGTMTPVVTDSANGLDDLQLTASYLVWSQTDSTGTFTSIQRAGLDGTSRTSLLDLTTALPSGYLFNAFYVSEGDGRVYVLSSSNTTGGYELGAVPIAGGSYTKIVDATLGSGVIFSERNAVTQIGTKLYAGASVSVAGFPQEGAVLALDLTASTATVIWSDSNTYPFALANDGAKAYWATYSSGAVYAGAASSISRGVVAVQAVDGLLYANGKLYGAGLRQAGASGSDRAVYLLAPGVNLSGTATLEAVAPLAQPGLIPTLAADATYLYVTTDHGVYKTPL